MSRGQALGVDPVHVRDLAEARAERFERFRETRERFGEPIIAQRTSPDAGMNSGDRPHSGLAPAPSWSESETPPAGLCSEV